MYTLITLVGFAEFVYTNLQSFENETSVEICVRTRGYGFSVNVSTVEQTAIGKSIIIIILLYQHVFNVWLMVNVVSII